MGRESLLWGGCYLEAVARLDIFGSWDIGRGLRGQILNPGILIDEAQAKLALLWAR